MLRRVLPWHSRVPFSKGLTCFAGCHRYITIQPSLSSSEALSARVSCALGLSRLKLGCHMVLPCPSLWHGVAARGPVGSASLWLALGLTIFKSGCQCHFARAYSSQVFSRLPGYGRVWDCPDLSRDVKNFSARLSYALPSCA